MATETIVDFLQSRGVSPAIIERVVRLNPDHEPGSVLRGIHYSNTGDPRWTCGATTKGDFIRKYGRSAFESFLTAALIKRGRRVYIRRQYAV